MIVGKPKFAQIAGVSRRSVYKQITAGALVVRPDGNLDTDNPVNQDYIRKHAEEKITELREQPSTTPKKTIKTKQAKQVQKTNTDFELEGIDDISLDEISDDFDFQDNRISSGMQKSELEKIKVIEQIKIQRLKRQIIRDELVSKKLIKSVFSKFYEIDMNEFLTIKDKLLPDIAAIFGVNDTTAIMKAGERMDEELWKVLKHIQQVKDRFLKSIKVEDEE